MSALKREKETEIFAKLDALRDNSIYAWLDEIKRDGAKDNKVPNPLSDKRETISTTSKGVIYPAIIKWCIHEYPSYDFTNIPNYIEISSLISGNPAAAAAAKANSPVIDYILIAKKWKNDPTKDGHLLSGAIYDLSKKKMVKNKDKDGEIPKTKMVKNLRVLARRLSSIGCLFNN